MTDPISNERLAEIIERARLLGDNADTPMSAGEVAVMALEIQSRRQSPAGVEPVWFAVQSASGAHIGMWQDVLIARRVFEIEYPDGKFIPLYADPPPKATTITEEVRGKIAYALTKRMVIDMPTARAAVDEALSSEAHNG